MYVLDQNKAEIVRLSNDAFFYLYQDEEPLDDCQAEIDRILAKFPNGYQIDPDEWEYADEPGIIEALFIPYVEPALDDYDLFVDDPYGTGDKDVEIRLKYHEGKARVKIWTHINSTNTDIIIEQNAKITYGERANYITSKKNSTLYVIDKKGVVRILRRFKKKSERHENKN